MSAANVFIGLGSNLDNPLRQIEQALDELASIPNCQLLQCSRIYRSKAIGPGDQPDYINAVALLESELTPLQLLDALQAIERAHNRVRLEHWGPRTLDLDILLFGNQIIDTDRLTVPHAYLTQRNFVLYPLADIAPGLKLPCGTTLATLLSRCPVDGLELLP